MAPGAVVAEMIDVVWRRGDLDALGRYWTDGCVNHAAAPDHQVGLDALTAYHRAFAAQLAGFSEVAIEVVRQVSEGDLVATQLLTTARHGATGRQVSLATMRFDRLEGDRIAEHWSVADLAGLEAQLGG